MNTDYAYIYIGGSPNTLDVAIPYPTAGDAPYKEEARYKEETNANGVSIRQKIGETVIVMELGWGKIDAEKWWEIGRFFEENGDLVYCKFFRHNLGEWQVKKFFKQPTVCNPVMVRKETGEPLYYTGAQIDLISVGE